MLKVPDMPDVSHLRKKQMNVRAKFRVTSVTQYENNSNEVTLAAVTGGSPENDTFFKRTPNASIKLSTINSEAAKEFVPGKMFYVDFSEAK